MIQLTPSDTSKFIAPDNPTPGQFQLIVTADETTTICRKKLGSSYTQSDIYACIGETFALVYKNLDGRYPDIAERFRNAMLVEAKRAVGNHGNGLQAYLSDLDTMIKDAGERDKVAK